MLAAPPAVALLLPPAVIDGLDPAIGVAFMAAWSIIVGVANGPLDIALFTIRQRRTDPAWTGRAFAVSMAMNFLGFPIGAAIAGVLATMSLASPIVLGIVACVAGLAFAAFLVPRRDEEPGAAA
jgi:MFS family permease